MSSITSISPYGEDHSWVNGLVKRRYSVTLTDNNLVEHIYIVGPYKVKPSDGGDTYANALLENLRNQEIDFVDKVPEWNDTQADYDRKALGRAMMIEDIRGLQGVLDLWAAVELRSGTDSVERAATLGISLDNYMQMESRFRLMADAATVARLITDKTWSGLPEEFK